MFYYCIKKIKNDMKIDTRPKKIVSYEKMSEAVAAAFAEKYPRGFDDFLQDVKPYTKPDGTPFYAVMLDLPEALYLVKINIKIDDLEDVEKWLDNEADSENEKIAGSDDSQDGGTLPDDNISQYAADDSADSDM